MDEGVRVTIITAVCVLAFLSILIVAAIYFVRSLRRLSETQQEASLKRAASGEVPRTLPRTRTGRLQLGLVRVGTAGRLGRAGGTSTTTGAVLSSKRPSDATGTDEEREVGRKGGPRLPKRRSSVGATIRDTRSPTHVPGGLRTWRDDGVSSDAGEAADDPACSRSAADSHSSESVASPISRKGSVASVPAV